MLNDKIFSGVFFVKILPYHIRLSCDFKLAIVNFLRLVSTYTALSFASDCQSVASSATEISEDFHGPIPVLAT
jgi:hypothetical protein